MASPITNAEFLAVAARPRRADDCAAWKCDAEFLARFRGADATVCEGLCALLSLDPSEAADAHRQVERACVVVVRILASRPGELWLSGACRAALTSALRRVGVVASDALALPAMSSATAAWLLRAAIADMQLSREYWKMHSHTKTCERLVKEKAAAV